ncbi:hypothetical protein [Streptomyces wuyuanensis]|uniref:hypothetical protein n=1 Tax=Streptomyces wuyuanensis TaxID=1196353 RepID=UPI0034198938
MVNVADGAQPGRVLLDPVTFCFSGSTALEVWRPSWSGRLLSFQLSSGGRERPDLRVWDVEAGAAIGHVGHPGGLTGGLTP